MELQIQFQKQDDESKMMCLIIKEDGMEIDNDEIEQYISNHDQHNIRENLEYATIFDAINDCGYFVISAQICEPKE